MRDWENNIQELATDILGFLWFKNIMERRKRKRGREESKIGRGLEMRSRETWRSMHSSKRARCASIRTSVAVLAPA